MTMCCTPRKWRMRPLPLLSSILSRQKTGPGMCRYHWLIFLFIVSLTLCHPHQIIGHGKNGKAHVFFFSRYKKRKILFVSILLLILVNINSVSLCNISVLSCVFFSCPWIPCFLSFGFFEVISEILLMIHFSNLLRKVMSTCAFYFMH